MAQAFRRCSSPLRRTAACPGAIARPARSARRSANETQVPLELIVKCSVAVRHERKRKHLEFRRGRICIKSLHNRSAEADRPWAR